jgi:hypothetical protein
MAGTIIADRLEAASTSQLVIENGVALTPPTIVDADGTQIGTFCRAWVNFNGTSTVAIREKFNVSSITDNGTGDYTINFTNAMPDANYSVNGMVQRNSTDTNFQTGLFAGASMNQTAASFRVQTRICTTAGLEDPTVACYSVFR